MVDYTKPAMRDESWRRWKGGAKLANQLRDFYTSKRVFERLGQAVPLQSASATATTDAQSEQQKMRGQMINAFFGRGPEGQSRSMGGYQRGGHR